MKSFFLTALAAAWLCAPSFAHGDKGCASCPMGKTAAAMPLVKPGKGEKLALFSAPKMNSDKGAQGVRSALLGVAGVRTVSADPQTKRVVVTYVAAKQTPAKLASALAKAGWPATEVKAVQVAAQTPKAAPKAVPKAKAPAPPCASEKADPGCCMDEGADAL